MDDSIPIIDVTPQPADFIPSDDIWAFLRRRKGSIGVVFVIGLILGAWLLISRPNVYEAESRVMIVRAGQGGPVSESELASEIELIRDPSHLDQAAARLITVATSNQVYELRQQIGATLSVTPAGKSNLVAIQYRDTDPLSAARVVNQIVDFYLADRRLIFQSAPRAANESGLPAQDLLTVFDSVNHGALLRSELQSRFQRRIDLEGRVADLKAQIRDQQEGAKVLRKRLGSLPERVHSSTSTRVSNGSPRQVEETEILNPLKQQLEAQILTTDSAIAGLQARLEETIKLLREAQAVENRTAALSSDREMIERRVQDSRDAVSPAERPNLRATLINRASPPYQPLPRYTIFWIPVAILAALAVAFLFAWLIDQFDRPIYTRGDFERASGIPHMDNFADGAGV